MGTPTRTAVTLYLSLLEEETGALIAAAASSRYASRARDLSRPGVSWACPRQGVRNLYGFVRFVYGFCTVLHGKVGIEVPGKQDNGGPRGLEPVAKPGCRFTAHAVEKGQANSGVVEGNGRKTGETEAWSCELGWKACLRVGKRVGREMSAGSRRSPACWHAVPWVEGREGRRRTP